MYTMYGNTSISCTHISLDYFQKPLLGDRPNTKPGDHGSMNPDNY